MIKQEIDEITNTCIRSIIFSGNKILIKYENFMIFDIKRGP